MSGGGKFAKKKEPDPILKDIITHNQFYDVNRGILSEILFPTTGVTGPQTCHSKKSGLNMTDIATIMRIPSHSDCQAMLGCFEQSKKIKAISCSLGKFDKKGVETLLKIYDLKEIAVKVKSEKKWLKKNTLLPNESCSLPAGMDQFTDLLLNTNDGKVVIEKSLLVSDLATLVGNSWLSLSLIQGYVDLLNSSEGNYTKTFILNNLVGMNKKELQNFRSMHGEHISYVSFIVNVAIEDEVTFVSNSVKRGCHWSLLCIDINSNKWHYIDTLGFQPPNDLADIVNAILEAFTLTGQSPAHDTVIAHKSDCNDATSDHCVHGCLPNIPLQSCSSICGVIVVVMAAIACLSPTLWRDVFLSRECSLPIALQWLLHPTMHASYLRRVLIHWLMKRDIDLSLLGIVIEWNNADGPSSRKHEYADEDHVDDDIFSNKHDNGDDKHDGDSHNEFNIENNHEDKSVSGGQKNDIPLEKCNTDDANSGNKQDDNDDQCDGNPSNKPDQDDNDDKGDGNSRNKHNDNNYNGDVDEPMTNGQQEEENDNYCNTSGKNDENSCGSVPISIGSEFHSYEELEDAIQTFEKRNFVRLYKRSSRSLKAYAKRCINKKINPDLIYSELTFACVHGGKKFKSTSKGQRPNQSTFRMGCPTLIKLTLSKDGQKLVVKEFVNEHNHEKNENMFKHLCKKRVPSKETKSKQHVNKEKGNVVPPKDINNMTQKKDGGLEDVIKQMQDLPGAKVEVYINEEQNVKGVYYQDEYMQNMFKFYPEILVVDASYKLNNLGMSLYVLMVVDGNGESAIVAIMLVADEAQETARQMLKFFKRRNEMWEKIECIMADKDMKQRIILKEEIPDAGLLICPFHTLQTFKREMTTKTMNLSTKELTQVLELLKCMAHAQTEEIYDQFYKQLMSLGFAAVKKYFNENWHSIREQWVPWGKNKYQHLINSNMNESLKSINQKLKSVLTHISGIVDFNEALQDCIMSLQNERNCRAASLFQKRPASLEHFGTIEQEFFNLCTPFALKYICNQLSLVNEVGKFTKQADINIVNTSKGHLEVTTECCTCDIFTSMKLPCSHIFALRKELEEPLYSSELCDKRWTKEHYSNCHHILKDNQMKVKESSGCGTFSDSVKTAETNKNSKVLSKHEKHKKAFLLAQKLVSIASESCGEVFDARIGSLQTLLDAWEHGRNVHILQLTSEKEEVGNVNENVRLPEIPEVTAEPLAVENASEDDPAKKIKCNYNTLHCNVGSTAIPNTEVTASKIQIDVSEEEEKKEDTTNIGSERVASKEEVNISEVQMPPAIKRRGRKKRADSTVIVLPRKRMKKEKHS